jgi:hypothetical protein
VSRFFGGANFEILWGWKQHGSWNEVRPIRGRKNLQIQDGDAKRMMEAFHNPWWMDETHKNGYMKFLESLAHYSIWNAKNIINSHWKKHRAWQEGLKDVITKVDLFVERLRLFTKSRNWAQSISWWRSTVGQAEEESQRRHLIALPPTARVIVVDRIEKKDGYATIRPVRIEGMLEIQS